MKSKMNVALVGCGVIAPNHINALLSLDSVKIVALCDIDTKKAYALAESFSISDVKIYSDYYKMLCEEKDLTSIHIATPHYLHADMAIEALRLDINVFLEKPMCISNEDIERLKEAESASAASLCVCFQNRFTNAVIEAKRITDADGGARNGYMTVIWKRDEAYYRSAEWRGRYSTEGGGVMINQAIHSLDLLTYFLGKPLSVTATKSNRHLKNIIEVEDTCEGYITFEGGGRALFYATTAAPSFDTTGIFLESENHRIEIKLPRLCVDGADITFEDDSAFIGKRCYGNGHARLIKLYYEAIESNSRMPVTISDAEYATRIINAAYKSDNMETII